MNNEKEGNGGKSEETTTTFTLKKKVTLWDLLLIGACVFTLSIAFYDLSHLNKIESRCIDGCNKHWLTEFNVACRNEMYDADRIYTLRYMINKTSDIKIDGYPVPDNILNTKRTNITYNDGNID